MIDYSSYTGTITVVPTGISSKKPDETPNLISAKGARTLLNVSVGKWNYWRRTNQLPEPVKRFAKQYQYRLKDIEKLKELL